MERMDGMFEKLIEHSLARRSIDYSISLSDKTFPNFTIHSFPLATCFKVKIP
jgi:hypothetical protein